VLIDAADVLHLAHLERILCPSIARALALELAMRLLFRLRLLQG
jgi:hypothetical protein